MTQVELEILNTLRDLEMAVQQMRTASPKPNLLPIFEKLEQLTVSLPKGTDPNLLHYLHRKSYEKARLHLEGREYENARGNCRH
jgi:hypothetical protein